jgi:hypothetical protein
VSAYRSGVDFERAVRANLRLNGFEVVRSAGSKTKVDLVAFKQGELLFVQCKRSGRVGPAERTALLALAELVDAVPVVAARAGLLAALGGTAGRVARVAAVSGHTGPRGGRIAYLRLTGPGPGDVAAWAPDRPDAA